MLHKYLTMNKVHSRTVKLKKMTGAGRGGRKTLSGKRNRVLVYILYNSSDIAANVPGLSIEVREFCKRKECLKTFMRWYFDGDSTNLIDEWCCNNCD